MPSISHIENGNRLAHHHREIELQGSLGLLPLADADIFPQGLGGSFHRFGSHGQARQQFHLLASVVKRSLRTDHRQHATHAGRQILVFDIQLGIEGKLPAMAMGAEIVRTH